MPQIKPMGILCIYGRCILALLGYLYENSSAVIATALYGQGIVYLSRCTRSEGRVKK